MFHATSFLGFIRNSLATPTHPPKTKNKVGPSHANDPKKERSSNHPCYRWKTVAINVPRKTKKKKKKKEKQKKKWTTPWSPGRWGKPAMAFSVGEKEKTQYLK